VLSALVKPLFCSITCHIDIFLDKKAYYAHFARMFHLYRISEV